MSADILILVVVVVITIAAFALESAGPDGARIVAISVGMFLVTAIIVGMFMRARMKRRREEQALAAARQQDDA